MKLIAAVDTHWAIGYQGKLLARISADQRFFKQTTMGHVVVYGRKTLEEFPHSKPLAGRTNIIMSRQPDYIAEGAEVVHSLNELMKALSRYNSDDIFVIGGESVYKELYPYCDTAVITKILNTYEADAFLPDLDTMPNWEIIDEGEIQHAETADFCFTVYKNHNPLTFE